MARAAELKAKGTMALGSRLKAKGFTGGKSAQDRAGGLRFAATARGRGLAFAVGRTGGQTGAQRAATAKKIGQMQRARAKSGKAPARTNKSPMSAAKARYKQLSSAARKSSSYRSAADNRKAAGARRSLASMIAKRGRR